MFQALATVVCVFLNWMATNTNTIVQHTVTCYWQKAPWVWHAPVCAAAVCSSQGTVNDVYLCVQPQCARPRGQWTTFTCVCSRSVLVPGDSERRLPVCAAAVCSSQGTVNDVYLCVQPQCARPRGQWTTFTCVCSCSVLVPGDSERRLPVCAAAVCSSQGTVNDVYLCVQLQCARPRGQWTTFTCVCSRSVLVRGDSERRLPVCAAAVCSSQGTVNDVYLCVQPQCARPRGQWTTFTCVCSRSVLVPGDSERRLPVCAAAVCSSQGTVNDVYLCVQPQCARPRGQWTTFTCVCSRSVLVPGDSERRLPVCAAAVCSSQGTVNDVFLCVQPQCARPRGQWTMFTCRWQPQCARPRGQWTTFTCVCSRSVLVPGDNERRLPVCAAAVCSSQGTVNDVYLQVAAAVCSSQGTVNDVYLCVQPQCARPRGQWTTFTCVCSRSVLVPGDSERRLPVCAAAVCSSQGTVNDIYLCVQPQCARPRGQWTTFTCVCSRSVLVPGDSERRLPVCAAAVCSSQGTVNDVYLCVQPQCARPRGQWTTFTCVCSRSVLVPGDSERRFPVCAAAVCSSQGTVNDVYLQVAAAVCSSQGTVNDVYLCVQPQCACPRGQWTTFTCVCSRSVLVPGDSERRLPAGGSRSVLVPGDSERRLPVCAAAVCSSQGTVNDVYLCVQPQCARPRGPWTTFTCRWQPQCARPRGQWTTFTCVCSRSVLVPGDSERRLPVCAAAVCSSQGTVNDVYLQVAAAVCSSQGTVNDVYLCVQPQCAHPRGQWTTFTCRWQPQCARPRGQWTTFTCVCSRSVLVPGDSERRLPAGGSRIVLVPGDSERRLPAGGSRSVLVPGDSERRLPVCAAAVCSSQGTVNDVYLCVQPQCAHPRGQWTTFTCVCSRSVLIPGDSERRLPVCAAAVCSSQGTVNDVYLQVAAALCSSQGTVNDVYLCVQPQCARPRGQWTTFTCVCSRSVLVPGDSERCLPAGGSRSVLIPGDSERRLPVCAAAVCSSQGTVNDVYLCVQPQCARPRGQWTTFTCRWQPHCARPRGQWTTFTCRWQPQCARPRGQWTTFTCVCSRSVLIPGDSERRLPVCAAAVCSSQGTVNDVYLCVQPQCAHPRGQWTTFTCVCSRSVLIPGDSERRLPVCAAAVCSSQGTVNDVYLCVQPQCAHPRGQWTTFTCVCSRSVLVPGDSERRLPAGGSRSVLVPGDSERRLPVCAAAVCSSQGTVNDVYLCVQPQCAHPRGQWTTFTCVCSRSVLVPGDSERRLPAGGSRSVLVPGDRERRLPAGGSRSVLVPGDSERRLPVCAAAVCSSQGTVNDVYLQVAAAVCSSQGTVNDVYLQVAAAVCSSQGTVNDVYLCVQPQCARPRGQWTTFTCVCSRSVLVPGDSERRLPVCASAVCSSQGTVNDVYLCVQPQCARPRGQWTTFTCVCSRSVLVPGDSERRLPAGGSRSVLVPGDSERRLPVCAAAVCSSQGTVNDVYLQVAAAVCSSQGTVNDVYLCVQPQCARPRGQWTTFTCRWQPQCARPRGQWTTFTCVCSRSVLVPGDSERRLPAGGSHSVLVPGDSERRLPVCAAAVCSSQGTVNDVYLQVAAAVCSSQGTVNDVYLQVAAAVCSSQGTVNDVYLCVQPQCARPRGQWTTFTCVCSRSVLVPGDSERRLPVCAAAVCSSQGTVNDVYLCVQPQCARPRGQWTTFTCVCSRSVLVPGDSERRLPAGGSRSVLVPGDSERRLPVCAAAVCSSQGTVNDVYLCVQPQCARPRGQWTTFTCVCSRSVLVPGDSERRLPAGGSRSVLVPGDSERRLPVCAAAVCSSQGTVNDVYLCVQPQCARPRGQWTTFTCVCSRSVLVPGDSERRLPAGGSRSVLVPGDSERRLPAGGSRSVLVPGDSERRLPVCAAAVCSSQGTVNDVYLCVQPQCARPRGQWTTFTCVCIRSVLVPGDSERRLPVCAAAVCSSQGTVNDVYLCVQPQCARPRGQWTTFTCRWQPQCARPRGQWTTFTCVCSRSVLVPGDSERRLPAGGSRSVLVPGDSERRLPVCAAAVCSSQGTVNDVYLQVAAAVCSSQGTVNDVYLCVQPQCARPRGQWTTFTCRWQPQCARPRGQWTTFTCVCSRSVLVPGDSERRLPAGGSRSVLVPGDSERRLPAGGSRSVLVPGDSERRLPVCAAAVCSSQGTVNDVYLQVAAALCSSQGTVNDVYLCVQPQCARPRGQWTTFTCVCSRSVLVPGDSERRLPVCAAAVCSSQGTVNNVYLCVQPQCARPRGQWTTFTCVCSRSVLVPGDSERRLPAGGRTRHCCTRGPRWWCGTRREAQTQDSGSTWTAPPTKHTNSQPYSKHNFHRMSIQLFIHVMTHLIHFYEQLYKYQIYV